MYRHASRTQDFRARAAKGISTVEFRQRTVPVITAKRFG
jgi:hypothetical protein